MYLTGNRILRVVLCCVFAAWLPLSLCAQNKPNDKKSVIKISKLDPVDADDEYSNIIIDQGTSEPGVQRIYQRPIIIAPPPMDDEQADTTELLSIDPFRNMEDEGTESEADILYATMDTSVIHYTQFDMSKWRDTTINLVNHGRHQEFFYPTPNTSRLTSCFGPRRRRFHYGIDLAMPTGEPIYAAFDGTVRISRFNSTYGNLIVIRHTNGLETYYAHMSRRDVHCGDHVTAGQTIGLCGNTGRSYGSHLHFEIRYLGRAINPEFIIDCTTQSLRNEKYTLTPGSFRKVASPRGAVTAVQGSSDVKYYRVRNGDTLSKIAQRNGTTVSRLCKLNGIKQTSVIRAGQTLRIR